MFNFMNSLLTKLHARLGDFWWYSLMLFCAARAADALNMFVGLWLVPKYVEPSELGAVQPLTQFANFLAIPIAVFAATFRQELTTLAVNRKFGQMKTLMRGVFIATAIFLFLAIILSRLLLPAFLERIRITEGMLGIVILVSSFVGTVAPIYTNALQSLKKFKANALINLIGAPVRLLAMLVTMPLRALTGYFVGQTAPSAFSIVGVLIGLRKELAVKAEPYWNQEIVKRFSRIFFIFLASSIAGGFAFLIETTIIRQRLPEMDSAGYYMATRFSEISGFLAVALGFTLFPFTAELAAKGKDTRPIYLKVCAAVIGTNAILALALIVFGKYILSILPHGDDYVAYWWAMPALVGVSTLMWVTNLFTTIETSAYRFGYLKWWIPLHLLYPAALLLVTGYGYFTAYLPTSWAGYLAAHNITSLQTMIYWMVGFQLLRLIGCTFAILSPHRATDEVQNR